MKIINLNDFLSLPLTVDQTDITVDQTDITVDQTLIETSDLFIKVIPKRYVDEVKVEYFNELTEKSQFEQQTVINSGGYMTIPISYTGFKEGDSLEITVRDLNDIQIWRGKGFATYQTDLQNWTLAPKGQNDIIKI